MYRKVKMWLTKVADIVPSTLPDDDGMIYVSKYDGSYITRVGMENDIRFLVKRGITHQVTNGVGYSPKFKKWYGWSHRAIYGFKIGSQVKPGDCAYMPRNREDYIQEALNFWSDKNYHKTTRVTEITDTEFHISWEYNTNPQNKKLHNTISGLWTEFPDRYGRGEWTAQTMEDAHQMAIDFCWGVS